MGAQNREMAGQRMDLQEVRRRLVAIGQQGDDEELRNWARKLKSRLGLKSIEPDRPVGELQLFGCESLLDQAWKRVAAAGLSDSWLQLLERKEAPDRDDLLLAVWEVLEALPYRPPADLLLDARRPPPQASLRIHWDGEDIDLDVAEGPKETPHGLMSPPPSQTSEEERRIPNTLRFRVLQRDAFRCQYCGRSARDGAVLHVDHVEPRAGGGETTEDNLITACDRCNLGKSDTPVL